MENTPVEIFKEDSKCLSTLLEDCPLNSSTAWVSGSSESRNVSHDDGWESESMSPIIPIITAVYSVVFVVGLLGNCLVMYVIIRYTKMKTATNIYIFNLALADALVTTTMPFQSTDYLLNTWPFGEVVCKVFISIDYYNMFISIFTLTMMSVDRYVAVCHPVKALDFRTPIKAKMINVCIWLLSSAAGIPAFILGGTQTNSDITECALQFPEPYVYWDTLMKVCVFVFAFVVPVLIITVCYSLMVLRLKSVRMLSGSREKDRNLRRITRLVVVVVAVFVVCWTPIHIFILIKALVSVPETTAIMAAYFFCVALGYTNSSLNPVLYAFLDENFKRCFKDFCLSAKLKGERVSGGKKAPSTVREASVPRENQGGTSKPT
ncbi:delta-type opioid receptor-like [Hippoglossus hippoglossus]|uniref:delta-type opioid receptor-like n=1 Tax=Hippoglossus hippoglossus TaxID=8267 RepID=UPI00148E1FE5|nr:delta-type opioid receptor-like [Hippoglossus hippoglossus]XP_034998461.1 delta-type opioid receptor [Hippoglossus stenolepis]